MKNTSDEIGVLMGCASKKLVIRSDSTREVLPSMASAMALTNSHEELKEVNGERQRPGTSGSA